MGLSSAEAERLSRLDANLRSEADEYLLASGLGEVLSAAGYKQVGSYAMHTMVWRDLDFERITDCPRWQDHWQFGQTLAQIDGIYRLACIDAYRDPHFFDHGLYWGLRGVSAAGVEWKFDLWTARPSEFAPGLAMRAKWTELLTEEARLDILAIKECARVRPEYGSTLLSIHVYQAVLEHGVRSIDDFLAWWNARPSE